MKIKTLAAVFVVVAGVAAPAFAEDLVFDLINNSSSDLNELYVSAHEADAWGEDVLGMEVLAVGENGNVTLTDGMATCDYDLRFVLSNGNTVEGTANLCETNSFTIHD